MKAGRSKIKAPADSVSSERSPPGSEMAASSLHSQRMQGARVLSGGLLYKGTNPIHVVFTLSGLITSVQFSRSVMSDSFHPMDCNTPGLPIHHQFLEFTQTHIHQVSDDAIQPSHPLLSPSPPAFNLSQPSGGLSIGVSVSASVLPMNTQD